MGGAQGVALRHGIDARGAHHTDEQPCVDAAEAARRQRQDQLAARSPSRWPTTAETPSWRIETP